MGSIPFSRSPEAAPRVECTRDDIDGLDAFLPETPAGNQDGTASGARHRRMATVAKVAVLALATVIVAALAGVAVYRRMAPAAADSAGLRVESDPPGASVTIDGTRRGTTPLSATVPPGHHVIIVDSSARRRTLAVDLAANTTTVHHVELPAAEVAGSLEVTTTAPGTVSVDGTDHGTTPAVIADLTPGDHDVVVTSLGRTYRRAVTVQAGARSSLVISDSPAAAGGWLSVPSAVPLTIRDHGRLVGTTESERIMLPAGEYDLEFRNETLGFRAARRATITAGRVSTVKVDLPQVPLQINAIPWAEVWIDGRRVGETPLANVPATVGNHEVVFRHPQLGERRMNTTVSLDTPARVTADMRVR